MGFDTVWRDVRDACEALEADAVLVTPATERAFTVVASETDRIVVRFLERDVDRSLRRDQFEVLYDRLESDPDGLSLADLPAGVEPYVSVLSILPRYAVVDSGETIRRSDAAERGSPLLRPEWEARSRPERVHDDALLLVDQLDRHDAADPESMATDALVDLYVLLSDVQGGADRLRRGLGDPLLDRIGPDDRLHGQFGTVRRTRRERRRLKDDDAVLDALDEEGIPHEWVLGVDSEKMDVVLAVTDLDEEAVYDVDEQVYVQKTEVEEAEKQSRLQGLRDRLADLDTDEAAELRHDIDELEARLDAVLAAG